MSTAPEIMGALAAPFADEAIQWRVIVAAGRQALVAPYVDARAVQDRLNEVLGLAGWQDHFEQLDGGAMLCVLRIRPDLSGNDWIERSDVGAAPIRRRPGLLTRLFPPRNLVRVQTIRLFDPGRESFGLTQRREPITRRNLGL